MKDNDNKPERVAVSEVPPRYVLLSFEDKKRFWKIAVDGAEHEFVRDFFICHTKAVCPKDTKEDVANSSFIVHLQSGEWCAFKLPYAKALKALQDKPSADRSLMRAIYYSVFARDEGEEVFGNAVLGFNSPENN